MAMIELKCGKCGGELKEDGKFFECRYCHTKYASDDVAQEKKVLSALLDEQKQEQLANRRYMLWEAIHAEYINSEMIIDLCRSLRKLKPEDFEARFFEIANSGNGKEINEFIDEIDVSKPEEKFWVEEIVKFMIKSLRAENILPLNDLIERAYKNTDLEKYEKYTTQVSNEAKKVQEGIYEPGLPRDVFVMYSSKDFKRVKELVYALEESGLRCFVAMRNLQHGRGAVANYQRALETAMDNCKVVVFLSSKNSRSITCDAVKAEMPYLKKKDIENAPYEYRLHYDKMPSKYKKPRVEYRLDNERSGGGDMLVKEFFGELEFVYSVDEVLSRVARYLTEEIEEKPQEKICISCGAKNPLSTKFCMECGGKEFAATKEEYERKKKEKDKAAIAEVERKNQELLAKLKAMEETSARENEERRKATETEKVSIALLERLKKLEEAQNDEAARKAEEATLLAKRQAEEATLLAKKQAEEATLREKRQAEAAKKAALEKEASEKINQELLAKLKEYEDEKKAAEQKILSDAEKIKQAEEIKKRQQVEAKKRAEEETLRKEEERKSAEEKARRDEAVKKLAENMARLMAESRKRKEEETRRKEEEARKKEELELVAQEVKRTFSTARKEPVRREGDFLYFGEYPQSKAPNVKKEDVAEVCINGVTIFTDKNGEKYMWAKSQKYSKSYINCDYYKFEPIKWRIIKEEDGKVLALAENMLDSVVYDPKGNNYVDYANSSIRKWLNEEFLNLAFSDNIKKLLIRQPIKNYVFLLDYEEVPNQKRVKVKKATEFAALRGGTYGTEAWLTATDSAGDRYKNYCIFNDPQNTKFRNSWSKTVECGVAPAVWIKLDNRVEFEEKRRLAEEEAKRKEAEKERKEAEKQKKAEEKKIAAEKKKEEQKKLMRRTQGVCQHCGGKFKGIFTKICSSCGTKKDY